MVAFTPSIQIKNVHRDQNMKVLFILLFPFSLLADEFIPCSAKIEIMNFSQLGLKNCDLAGAMVDSLGLREFHQKKIHDILATKLATQVEQNMEEMALLDQFYSFNDSEIPSNSEVKRECRLDLLNDSAKKCGGEKLELLRSKLSSKGATLFEQLTNKFANVLNVGAKSRQKSCPLQDTSNDFILSGQIDYFNAINIIRETKLEGMNKANTQAYYNQFPQLKLIAKSNSETKSAFQHYLLQFKGKPEEAQKYISTFFTDPKNAPVLSKGIADQCALINKNVSTFLCKDLEQLGSLNPSVSTKLFSGLEPKTNFKDMEDIVPQADTPEGELFFSAYGFQCQAQKQTPLKISQSENIDQWYSDFTKNIRPDEVTGNESGNANVPFCKIYTCSDSLVDNINHCPNGKHPTSMQISDQYNCPIGKTCTNQISQFVAYLAILDKEEARTSLLASSQSSQDSGQSNLQPRPDPQGRYSSFTANLLGVEGIQIAEGKTPLSSTSLALTPRSKESFDKTEKASAVAATVPKAAPEKAAQSKDQAQAQAQQAQSQTVNSPHELSSSAFTQDQNTHTNESFVSKVAPKASASPKAATTRASGAIGQYSDSSNESAIRKLRDELEAVTGSLKGNGAEKVAAIADNNARFSPASLGGVTKGNELAGLNNAERERLDQYQRNLNSWESRLRNWQSDLATREVRTPAGTTSQAAAANKSPEGSDPSSRSAKGTTGSGSSEAALQLTASEGDKGKNTGAKTSAAVGSGTSADSPEAVVTSDELSKLKIDNLKKLGINYKSAFIMKIKYQQKFYDVPVKAFTYKGKDILIPLLTEQNSILSKIVLESPLFSDYKQLQLDRQKERQEFSRVI